MNIVIYNPVFLLHLFVDNLCLHILYGVHKLNDGKYSAIQGSCLRGDGWTCPPQQFNIEGHNHFCPTQYRML